MLAFLTTPCQTIAGVRMTAISLEDGTYLVSLARRAISEYFETGKKISPNKMDGALSDKIGVFVTLNTYPARELRGRFGCPMPINGLAFAVVDGALSAAFEDNNFTPLEKDELEKLIIELTVLSPSEEIKVKTPEEYIKKIKIGRDGLTVRYGYSSSILLPQAPIEWNWNEKEFLCHLCQTAGLPPEMWRSPSVHISKFEAQIFCEDKPKGKTIQKRLIR